MPADDDEHRSVGDRPRGAGPSAPRGARAGGTSKPGDGRHERGRRVRVEPRDEHVAARGDQALGDATICSWRLALAEDHLAEAVAELAMMVEAREAEVLERQRAQPLERLVDRGLAAVRPRRAARRGAPDPCAQR